MDKLETISIALIKTTINDLITNKKHFSNSNIWAFMLEREIVNESFEKWVHYIFRLIEDNVDKLYTIYSKEIKDIIGLIRLHNISKNSCKAEVITLIFEHMQRKGYGVEAKKILIEHAFKDLNLNRLEFYIDQNNTNSIKSIMKLGATYEGTLKNHIQFNDGYIRSSRIYSILKS